MSQNTEIKRPFATYYYADIHCEHNAYSTQGHAATEQGAIRASVVRVFLEQHAMAVIIDRRTGVPIYSVKRGVQGISVHYGTSTTTTQLKRVK